MSRSPTKLAGDQGPKTPAPGGDTPTSNPSPGNNPIAPNPPERSLPDVRQLPGPPPKEVGKIALIAALKRKAMERKASRLRTHARHRQHGRRLKQLLNSLRRMEG